MEEERMVKYYSPIDRRWLYIKVNNEVYKYFDREKKRRKAGRKKRQLVFEEGLVLYDPDGRLPSSRFCEDKNMDVERAAEDREFAEIIWRAVAKLNDEQKALIVDRFVTGLDLVQISDKYGVTKGGVTQLFDVIYHHLRLLLTSDHAFQQTDYAAIRKRDYIEELKQFFDNNKTKVLDGLFSGNNGNSVNKIIEFSKRLKQEFKISEKLKITH